MNYQKKWEREMKKGIKQFEKKTGKTYDLYGRYGQRSGLGFDDDKAKPRRNRDQGNSPIVNWIIRAFLFLAFMAVAIYKRFFY